MLWCIFFIIDNYFLFLQFKSFVTWAESLFTWMFWSWFLKQGLNGQNAYKCKKKKRSAQHMCITQNVQNTKYEGKNSKKE